MLRVGGGGGGGGGWYHGAATVARAWVLSFPLLQLGLVLLLIPTVVGGAALANVRTASIRPGCLAARLREHEHTCRDHGTATTKRNIGLHHKTVSSPCCITVHCTLVLALAVLDERWRG